MGDGKEEIRHDNDGHADGPEIVGRREEPAEDAQGIARADRSIREQDVEIGLGDEGDDAQVGVSLGALHFTSGPIPEAAELAAYPVEIQEKIIDWQERQVKALFDDESERQDRLADAEIAATKMNLAFSFAIDALIVGGTLAAFALTGDPNVFWAYTVLGASVVGNTVVNFNKSRRDDER